MLNRPRVQNAQDRMKQQGIDAQFRQVLRSI